MAFDTLTFSETLQSGGFSKEQADTLAHEQRKLVDDELATKEFIRAENTKIKLWVASSYSLTLLGVAIITKFL